jgi:hypothetical protein
MREFDLNIERVLENWTVAHVLDGRTLPALGAFECLGGPRLASLGA